MRLYNSLTKEKEQFTPITPKTIKIYVCGITVYDYCHIGHARSMLTFDMMTRYWRAKGFKVYYVRNITDIDDKIINRANETKQPLAELTDYFIKAMNEDTAALAILPPDSEPRATAHIEDIVAMIATLIEKGYAYAAENGDVYYHLRAFADYGKLSNKTLDDLQVGARIEANEQKQDPLDFVLWKAAKPDEPSWDSPWGKGRPGWHIECSAMSCKALGATFDIHGGGGDLKFPHHENELAQSEAATGETFVNYWVHAGLVQVNNEKMSKSLGNFFTIREVLKEYRGEVIRYFMLSSHYRSPVSYSQENLQLAKASLDTLYTALRDINVSKTQQIQHSTYWEKFQKAMDDDFNTPEALGVLFEIAHELNKCKTEDKQKAEKLAADLWYLANILGLLQQSPAAYFQESVTSEEERQQIEQLIEKRRVAREQKDWATADSVREQLTAVGISLEDSAAGTLWRKN